MFGVWGLGFMVWGVWCRVCVGLRFPGIGSPVLGLGFKFSGSRVQGFRGSRVQGLGGQGPKGRVQGAGFYELKSSGIERFRV